MPDLGVEWPDLNAKESPDVTAPAVPNRDDRSRPDEPGEVVDVAVGVVTDDPLVQPERF